MIRWRARKLGWRQVTQVVELDCPERVALLPSSQCSNTLEDKRTPSPKCTSFSGDLLQYRKQVDSRIPSAAAYTLLGQPPPCDGVGKVYVLITKRKQMMK